MTEVSNTNVNITSGKCMQVACNYMKVAATCTNFGKVAATDILLRVSYTEFVEVWLYF